MRQHQRRMNAGVSRPNNFMRITIGFWELVKFTAAKNQLTATGAFERLREVQRFGSHGHKRVRVNLPPADVVMIRTEKILRRVRHCECGAVAVVRGIGGCQVCLKCSDLENRRALEAFSPPEEVFA